MDANSAVPLVRSFERHLRAANRTPTTVATYLHAVRQAHGFLQARGTTLEAATRADLEAFMADCSPAGRPPTRRRACAHRLCRTSRSRSCPTTG